MTWCRIVVFILYAWKESMTHSYWRFSVTQEHWFHCLTLMSMMSALLVALLYCGWGIKTWGLRNCSVPSYNPTEKSPATILMFAALKTQTNTDFHKEWFITWVKKINFYCILLYFCFNVHCNMLHVYVFGNKTVNYHTHIKIVHFQKSPLLYLNFSYFCCISNVTLVCLCYAFCYLVEVVESILCFFFHLYYPDFDNSSTWYINIISIEIYS